MSGKLIIDTIESEDQLTINGKLKTTDEVTIENILPFGDDTIDDCSLLAVKKSDNTLTSVSDSLLIPPGTVMSYAGPCETDPSGWLLCDGRYFLIDENNKYHRLYQTIGKRWGTNDIGTVFRIPDLRGRFVRGVDTDGFNDPDIGDRSKLNDDGSLSDDIADEFLGSYQDDALQLHEHTMPIYHWSSSTAGNNYSSYGSNTSNGSIIFTNSIESRCRISSETRPKNAAMNYIIKI